MKRILISLLQLFILFGLLNQSIYPQKRDLVIELSTEKTQYVEHEEIMLNIKVVNKSKGIDSVWICGEDYNFVTGLNVTDDKGKKYRYSGAMIDCMDYYVKLYPGRFLEWCVPILSSYGDVKSDLTLHYTYLQEGKYTISFDGRPGLNNPVMKSNEIKFDITKPGDEDGFEKLKRICSIIDEPNQLDSLTKFIYDYPKSAYLDIAFIRLMLRTHSSNNYYSLYKVIKLFFSLRSDSWHSTTCLIYSASLIKKFKDEDTMIDFLVYIIKKYPGSKAATTAYEKLERTVNNDVYLKLLLK